MSRQEKFSEYLKAVFNLAEYSQKRCTIECVGCGEQTDISSYSISRHIKNGTTPVCSSFVCKPKIIAGWSLIETCRDKRAHKLQCLSCEQHLWHHKKVKYLKCYCQLTTKRRESSFYDLLLEKDLVVFREAYFNKELSSHKVDFLILREDGSRVFIELDDINHFAKTSSRFNSDKVFQEIFRNNRKENEFLLRVPDYLSSTAITALVENLADMELSPLSLYSEVYNSETGDVGVLTDL